MLIPKIYEGTRIYPGGQVKNGRARAILNDISPYSDSFCRMKIFKDRLDLSQLEPLHLLMEDAVDRQAEALLEAAVGVFAEMASEVMYPLGADDDMGLSAHSVDRQTLVRENVRRYILKAPASDLIAIQKYIKLKLRDYAIGDVSSRQRWN